MIDYMNKKCKRCLGGYYSETSPLDDIQGVLHCVVCNHQVKRWN
jgi:hypothetical protein